MDACWCIFVPVRVYHSQRQEQAEGYSQSVGCALDQVVYCYTSVCVDHACMMKPVEFTMYTKAQMLNMHVMWS